MEWWESFKEWFLGLGENYGVNPVIFGAIYVGAIPFFTLSLGWLIKNIKKNKPVTVPVLLTGFFFISAYLYLIFAGKNIPIWVYLIIAGLVGFGIYSIIKKVRQAKANQ